MKDHRQRGLMVGVAMLLALASGCGELGAPRPASVTTLLEHSEAWQGEQVAVQGRIRSEQVPERYWLEGAGQQRIELHPPERIGAYLGREVQISGRFEFKVGGQRLIEISNVTPLDKPTPKQ